MNNETTTLHRTLRIEIDSADDAVQDPHEIVRILKGLAERIALSADDAIWTHIYDVNGVRIGEMEYQTSVED